MTSLFTDPYKYREKENKGNLENYLTEKLAGILRRDEKLLLSLLNLIDVKIEKIESLDIQTQVLRAIHNGITKVIPDLEIILNHKIHILIECKVESQQGNNQLNNYLEILEIADYEKKYLVYLTKYKENITDESISKKIKHILWSDIYKISKNGELFSTELAKFIKDKRLNMPENITHLDALVIENLSYVIQKMDTVLNSAHDYHKSDKGLGISLGGGRSRELIKSYGYYIIGKKDSIEYLIGFFDSPVKLSYRIQSNKLEPKLVNYLENKKWLSLEHENLEQIEKSEKLTCFMNSNQNEMNSMIEFLFEAINDVKEYEKLKDGI